jgi:hypothetical protein
MRDVDEAHLALAADAHGTQAEVHVLGQGPAAQLELAQRAVVDGATVSDLVALPGSRTDLTRVPASSGRM